MTISGQNFEIYQGNDREIIITVRETDGSLTNLLGYQAVWVVFSQSIENIVLTKSTSSGIVIPDPSSGELHIALEEADTEDMVPKNYGHQCEVLDPSGNNDTVTTGFMKVLKSLTHTSL